MRLDQASVGALSLRHSRRASTDFDAGRLANLALLAIVLLLASLWLVFPPVDLSNDAASGVKPAQEASLAQTLPDAGSVPR